MIKESVTADELALLVREELHRARGCECVSGLRVAPRGDGWWVPDGSVRDMRADHDYCAALIPAIVKRLSQRYDLKR